MKAAEIAARRGHQVTLYEEKKELGGQFILAAIPPGKQVLGDFTAYLTRQLKKQPVKIVMGNSFNLDLLRDGKPDVAIVATGASPSLPSIEGIRETRVFTVEDALLHSAQLGQRVLVLGGGGIGAEVADHLSEMGKEVTLVEMREAIALDLVVHLQHFLNKRLREKGVRILTSTKAVRFEKQDLWVEDPQGTRKLPVFDSVVISLGSKANDELVQALKGKVSEVYVVGDASKPREVMEAVLEGEEVALKI
jgi:NADPH-dependent 2,4-dienoyl-CoA reductase/sulfur reductase-like enzyme